MRACEQNADQRARVSDFKSQMSKPKGRMPANSPDVRNPKCLTTHLNSLQATLRQLCLPQTQKSKVREIAQHRLKPTVSGEEFAHAPFKKFIRVESQHGKVLRNCGRGDRIK